MSQQVELLIDGPATAKQTIVLAQGAVAGMETPFMATFATGLVPAGPLNPRAAED